MKKHIFLFLVSIIVAAGSYAQSVKKDSSKVDRSDEIRTLAGRGRHGSGGYGSFGAGYTVIDGSDAVDVNGRAAWIAGHSFAIGVAGHGFINNYHFNSDINRDVNLSGGYGGLLIEPILLPKMPIHLSFPVVAGAGGVVYLSSEKRDLSWDVREVMVEDSNVFLLVEPGVELEINVLKFFRIAFGISYRFTNKIDLYDTPSDALTGFTTGISLKFGKF